MTRIALSFSLRFCTGAAALGGVFLLGAAGLACGVRVDIAVTFFCGMVWFHWLILLHFGE